MSLNPAAAIVARKLKQQGYSNAQIAGVLGNISQESGFNPRVNEGGAVGGPMGRGGYGLAQWTGSRQTDLVNFAKNRKLDPGDAGLQADFLLHELQGPESRAAESLRKAQSPEQAALVFRRDFERAGIPKDENRMRAARDVLPKLQTLEGGIDFAPPALPGEKQSVAYRLAAAGIDLTGGQEEDQSTTANTLLEAFKQQVIPTILPQGIMGIGAVSPFQVY
jgi:hypothetical protein